MTIDVTDDSSPRSLDDVLDGLHFAMVTTRSGTRLTARPLTLLEATGTTLRFLVSHASDWVQELASGPADVQVAFADPGGNRWVALTGRGTLSTDQATLDRLWSPAAGIFFEGRDDPDLTALEVEVNGGEWWQGPSGRVGRAIALVRAAATGDERKVGDHGVVTSS